MGPDRTTTHCHGKETVVQRRRTAVVVVLGPQEMGDSYGGRGRLEVAFGVSFPGCGSPLSDSDLQGALGVGHLPLKSVHGGGLDTSPLPRQPFVLTHENLFPAPELHVGGWRCDALTTTLLLPCTRLRRPALPRTAAGIGSWMDIESPGA